MQLDILKVIDKPLIILMKLFFDIFSIGKDNIDKVFNENKSQILYVMVKNIKEKLNSNQYFMT